MLMKYKFFKMKFNGINLTFQYKNFHEVQLISISRLMMAYGLVRKYRITSNITLFIQPSPPPTSMRIKQKKLATYYKM